MSSPGKPSQVTYQRGAKLLILTYADGQRYELPAELLRVWSPSAEVRGHGAGERKLQSGKKHVAINRIEAVGNYALRLLFDDGHDSGLYTWALLADLGENREKYYRDYLAELKAANASRLPAIRMGHWEPPSKS